MINFTIGCLFDFYQLKKTIKLNSTNKEKKISSFYGNLRSDYLNIGSARPDYRIPNVGKNELKKFIQEAKHNGIEFEYTINSPLVNSISDIHNNLIKIKDIFKQIEDFGTHRVIIGNYLLAEIFSSVSEMPIKISTIIGMQYPSQIRYLNQINVDMLCVDIYCNKNVPLLKRFRQEAIKYDIKIELLANEFCMYGAYPCKGLLRDACYAHSALGGNKNKQFNNWPFARCENERKANPVSILKAPFILPQHLNFYNNIGIEHFKLTGRTNTMQYVDSLMDIYFSEEYLGALSNLFMLSNNKLSDSTILVSSLEQVGFFNKWYEDDAIGCDYSCDICNYCENMINTISKNGEVL